MGLTTPILIILGGHLNLDPYSQLSCPHRGQSEAIPIMLYSRGAGLAVEPRPAVSSLSLVVTVLLPYSNLLSYTGCTDQKLQDQTFSPWKAATLERGEGPSSQCVHIVQERRRKRATGIPKFQAMTMWTVRPWQGSHCCLRDLKVEVAIASLSTTALSCYFCKMGMWRFISLRSLPKPKMGKVFWSFSLQGELNLGLSPFSLAVHIWP